MMDGIHKVQQAYEEISIYRSLLLYDDHDAFMQLKRDMLQDDFSFVTTTNKNGRIYALHIDEFDDNKHDMSYIDWDSINVVFCHGVEAQEFGTHFFHANELIEYIIDI